ncbi:MAG: T9SS type A sorting domain-containing protein [Ignavibacteriales bacterium]|nr:T9SS type A sorting domain-containing protein [Ignavibacteriales bacterium]
MKTFFTLCFVLLTSAIVFSQPYTWQLKRSGTSLGGPIDVESANFNNVYFGSDNKIYRSTDRGETFTQMGINVPGATEIKNIILNDRIPGTMLVAIEASSDKILKTTDYGASWNIVLDGLSFSFFGIPMTPDPTHPDTIYTMSNSNFIRSTDFGTTWTTISTSVGTSTPCDIEVFPDTSIILLGDNGTGIFRSTDYGLTWTSVFNTSGEIPTIAVDLSGSGTAWATKWSGGGGFLKSTNFGQSWTSIPFFNGNNMWGVHVAPQLPSYLISACYSCGGAYISKDNGASWFTTSISFGNYQIYIADTSTVFAAQGDGLYKLFSPSFIPVELSSFSASVINDNINLNWTTATEVNNQGFEIEQSNDGVEFTKIGYVPGFGTSTEVHSYSYSIEKSFTGKQYFRLRQIDFDGKFEYSDVVEVDAGVPSIFELAQNFPNPFNPNTSIKFTLPEKSRVKISVYNLLGQIVSEITNADFSAGINEVNFKAENLSSGIYVYLLEATGINGSVYSASRKMTLLK